ncbi:MAG: HAMP domain-containing histidine kinase [Candidatus Eisenbacteria bacterium]|nr:HAMP domain-containing histidine kinase [Candidatus Eisenbacteria bacterium]
MDRDRPNVRYIEMEPGPVRLEDFSPAEREILDRINRKIAAAESLESLIDFLFTSTRSLSPCDRIGVAFLEEEGARLSSHVNRASYEPLLLKKGYTEEMAGGSLEAVIRRGAIRIIGDLERYREKRPESRSSRLLLREGVRSNMTCPLRVDDRIVGVLFRSSRTSDAYDDRQARLHLAVAERLSQAVEKTYRIEQLDRANRAYLEMLGFVSHELKSPLASMVMDAAVLGEGGVGDLSPEQKEKIRRMSSKAEYLLSLVGEYLDLSRIEGGELRMRPLPDVDVIADVAEAACAIAEAPLREKGMTLERRYGDGPVRAECDPNLLKIVAVNLVGNAVKYGREGGAVRITVERPANRLVFAVWNEGPGFPEKERPKLFRRFSRIRTPELMKQKGTGVGLYTSWRIVRLHGGRIDADSLEGEWAEFRFEIPQPLPAEREGPDEKGKED